MPKISALKDLFDEHNEIAAWLVLLTAIVLLVLGRVGELTFVSMLAMSLVTLLGSKYYKGVKVSKDGFEISSDE
jgi:hypothetical protein